jgi:hypothetical protein
MKILLADFIAKVSRESSLATIIYLCCQFNFCACEPYVHTCGQFLSVED